MYKAFKKSIIQKVYSKQYRNIFSEKTVEDILFHFCGYLFNQSDVPLYCKNFGTIHNEKVKKAIKKKKKKSKINTKKIDNIILKYQKVL